MYSLGVRWPPDQNLRSQGGQYWTATVQQVSAELKIQIVNGVTQTIETHRTHQLSQ
jgi:hypothetical protein